MPDTPDLTREALLDEKLRPLPVREDGRPYLALHTSRLLALTAALAAARTVDDVADIVVAQTVAATGAMTGMLVLRAADADDALIVRESGFPDEARERFARIPLAMPGPASQCVRTGEPVWVSGHDGDGVVERFPALADVWARFGVSAVVTVPLDVAGDTIGAISFTWREPKALPADVRDFFLALGRQAAQAVERARLFEAERAALARATALQRVTAALSATVTATEATRVVAEQCAAVLGASGAVVAMVAADGQALEVAQAIGYRDEERSSWGRIPLSTPAPLVEAVRRNEPVFIESVEAWAARYGVDGHLRPRAGSGAWAALPLEVEGRVFGALGFSFVDGTHLGAEDRAFAASLAQQCSQAIERARLFAAEHEARGRAERLQSLTASLARARTLDDVATVVVEESVAALGARTGALTVHARDVGALVLVRHVGFPPPAAARVERQDLDGAAPVPECFRTGTAIWVESRDGPDGFEARYPALADVWAMLGVGSAAILPLVTAGESVGVVSFGFAEPRAFTTEDRAFLLAVGQQAALAVERARLFEAERLARQEAEAANRSKAQFLATMSHELRTPLNAIGGYADLMELEVRGPVNEAQREDLRRIKRSQHHLLGLINEVLNYAKIESGAVRYDLENVRVHDALAQAEGLVAPQARARGLTLRIAEAPPDLVVRADAEKLRQVLVNLLVNAVKFTDAGGAIAVDAAPLGDTVAIHVRDTGVGIAPEKLDVIFEPFVQLGRTLSARQEGVGLGLAISRDLARGMGGDLTAESTLGAGSVFRLTLPKGE